MGTEFVFDKDVYDVFLKSAIKKFKETPLGFFNDIDPRVYVLPTNLIGLDNLIGNGGFVLGTVLELYGLPGSGKTSMAVHLLKNAQDLGYNTMFLDAEGSLKFNPGLPDIMGVDKTKLLYVNPSNGEECFGICESFMRSFTHNVIVIDSIAALVPKGEDEDVEKSLGMGSHARMVARGLRNTLNLINKSLTLLIVINQIRYKITSFSDPTTTTGGNSLEFYDAYKIKMTGSSNFKSSWIKDANDGCAGHTVTFFVQKNKFKIAQTKTEAGLLYGQGFDLYAEVFDLSVDFGFIEQAGHWYSYAGERLGNGRTASINKLRDNESVYKLLRGMVVDIVSKQATVQIEEVDEVDV